MPLPTVDELERAALLSWPAIEEEWHGKWVARFARGYTGRANSIQSLDLADDDNPAERIGAISQDYRRRNLTPLFRVTPFAGPNTVAVLDDLGWERFNDSLVLAMELSKRARPVAATTQYFEPTDPNWWQVQASMSGREGGNDALGDVVARITAPARGVMLFDDNFQPAAAALVVNADGIAMFLNVVVAESQRGQGLGRAVMHAGLNWAGQSGARQAGLQVAADNEQALPLYKSLGFEEVYAYHYRRPRP